MQRSRRGRTSRNQDACRLETRPFAEICDGYRKRQTCISGREEVGPHGTSTPADLRRGRLQRSST
eukprot:3297573-Pleurochrysis_carterae.AAC.1